MILKQTDPENVDYRFDDEIDFSQYEDKMVIAGNKDFKEFGKRTLLDIVNNKYYDDDKTLIENEDGTCYEETIGYGYETKDELEKVSKKKNWVEGTISGYSQSDWQTIWYVEGEVTKDEIDYIEAFYMGKVSEFTDEDMIGYKVPDDIVWEGKEAICNYLGLDKDDTEIYDENDEIIE